MAVYVSPRRVGNERYEDALRRRYRSLRALYLHRLGLRLVRDLQRMELPRELTVVLAETVFEWVSDEIRDAEAA